MGFYIVHLVSFDQYLSIDKDRLSIKNRKTGEKRFLPLDDIALVISATPQMTVTAKALSRLSEKKIPLLVCNEKFQPSGIVTPYHSCTQTSLLYAQTEFSPSLKKDIWRKLVQAKIRNQAEVLKNEDQTLYRRLLSLAREARYKNPDPRESYAAQVYWRWFFGKIASQERIRVKRSRQGINGILDFGYAVLRSALLRYLAVYGFIAALGIHHKEREGGFPLADDLMEPLRPFVDRSVMEFVRNHPEEDWTPRKWVEEFEGLMKINVKMGKKKFRFLYALDVYVRSLARAMILRESRWLKVPLLRDEEKT